MKWKILIKILFFILLGCSVCVMLFFGKETFHIQAKHEAAQIDYRYHFVLIPEEVDNEYWRLVESGARDAAEKYNIYLEYLGPFQADMDEHIKTFDLAIASMVDGIMTQGISELEFTPLINKAIEKEIPVVTVDTDAPLSRRRVYIGTDNYYAGFLAGEAFLIDTKGEQYVGVITGRLDASHQKLRVEGFKDAVKNEERIHLIETRESHITKLGAVEAAYEMVKEFPEINAFYGTSALDGAGIAQVMKRLNKVDETYLMAFDTLPETIELIQEGTIDATVVQHPYLMGFEAVETLVNLKQGKNMDKVQHTETTIVRKKDLPLENPGRTGQLR
ncbi:sugar-binding protein [Metabacillus arenae]|uniref:Sugar-binding protein n=1 Tax=Metabacillus arenae TaxID=2771434 RepID=A0A926NLP4_9BACI|nr:sugar-binding protein [Metabacillus arenae]MBD1382888.1 sugar-binding protein [Metabacillus arenae]